VAIYNLMEDAATSEISRSQIWQWLYHGKVSAADVKRIADEEQAKLGEGYEAARALVDEVATSDEFVDFLTIPAYARLG
jgi:malate synthase